MKKMPVIPVKSTNTNLHNLVEADGILLVKYVQKRTTQRYEKDSNR